MDVNDFEPAIVTAIGGNRYRGGLRYELKQNWGALPRFAALQGCGAARFRFSSPR
jgi:hypothetical protein